MKTILQILAILLIAVAVSGGIYALVENTSLISSTEVERGAPSQMTGTESGTMPTRPERGDDHDAASLSRGLGEVGMLLAKITGITIVILLIQKGMSLFQKNKPIAVQ